MELRIKHTPETALSIQGLSDQMTLQIDFNLRVLEGEVCGSRYGWNAMTLRFKYQTLEQLSCI